MVHLKAAQCTWRLWTLSIHGATFSSGSRLLRGGRVLSFSFVLPLPPALRPSPAMSAVAPALFSAAQLSGAPCAAPDGLRSSNCEQQVCREPWSLQPLPSELDTSGTIIQKPLMKQQLLRILEWSWSIPELKGTGCRVDTQSILLLLFRTPWLA